MTIEPLSWVVLMLLLWCVGCTTPAEQASIYLEKTRVPAELKPDFECFAVHCSKCHQLSRALNAHITSVEHWDRYVARMKRTPGSGISPREAPSILRFLHWHTEARNREALAKAQQADESAAMNESPTSAAKSGASEPKAEASDAPPVRDAQVSSPASEPQVEANGAPSDHPTIPSETAAEQQTEAKP